MSFFNRNKVSTNHDVDVNENNLNERSELPEKATGKIMKVNKNQDKGGYGFISSKDIPFTRIFFHWSGLNPDTLPFLELEPGMIVEFKPIQWTDGKMRAIKVKVIDTNTRDTTLENELDSED